MKYIDKIIVIKNKVVNFITKYTELKELHLIRIDRYIEENKMIDKYIYREV